MYTIPVVSPLIIPAFAIGVTLCYASFLDIRERRVVFDRWYPAFFIIIPFSFFMYGFYLLKLDNIQFFTFIFITVAISVSCFACDYGYTVYKYCKKPSTKDLFNAGISWLLFAIPPASIISGFLAGIILFISIAAVFFCILIFFFGIYFYGGADYIALLLIGVGIPLFPIEPLMGYPVVSYFPWSAFLNALVLNIFTPIGIFLFNRYHFHRAPLRYQFLGFPVRGEDIQNSYGFVLEVIEEKEGGIYRRFLTFREIIGSLFSKTNRIYTKDLRMYPEKYSKELEMYKKSGTVWISYGIPFIVPITLGFISAIFIGDIVFILMNFVAG